VKDNYVLSGFLTVISYGLAMIVSFFLIEVKAEKEERPQDSLNEFTVFLKEICRNKKLFLFLLSIGLMNETHQTITVFLSQLQYVRVGIGSSMMGMLYGLITIIALCGFLSDKVTKSLGEHRTMRICFIASIISCIILVFTKIAVPTVIAIVLLRVGFSIAGPLQQELQNRQVKTANRATELSVNSVFMSSVGVATNVIFGALAEYSLIVAFGFGAVICMIAWLMYEIWNRM
jgi:Na+/melibiose symporter-like transporter